MKWVFELFSTPLPSKSNISALNLALPIRQIFRTTVLPALQFSKYQWHTQSHLPNNTTKKCKSKRGQIIFLFSVLGCLPLLLQFLWMIMVIGLAGNVFCFAFKYVPFPVSEKTPKPNLKSTQLHHKHTGEEIGSRSVDNCDCQPCNWHPR